MCCLTEYGKIQSKSVRRMDCGKATVAKLLWQSHTSKIIRVLCA